MNKSWNKAYLAISRSNSIHFKKEIAVLRNCLLKYHLELFVFVEQYDFKTGEEKDMMATAFEEIDESQLLIVELSKKAIGVGIELGYAKAKGKPIIYIKRKNEEYSSTALGACDHYIEYSDASNLELELEKIMKTK